MLWTKKSQIFKNSDCVHPNNSLCFCKPVHKVQCQKLMKIKYQKKRYLLSALMQLISNGYPNQMLKALSHLSPKTISLPYLGKITIDL